MAEDELQHEIESLNGEMFALRALLFYTLDVMSRTSPHAVRTVFDAAANHAENAAIRFGKSASPEHLVKSLRIIEGFRSKIFPDKHG